MPGRDDFTLPFVFIPDEAGAAAGPLPVSQPVRLRATLVPKRPRRSAPPQDEHRNQATPNVAAPPGKKPGD